MLLPGSGGAAAGAGQESTGSPACSGLEAAGPKPLPVLQLPAPEMLTLKSNFNNLINYTICFIGWSE